MRRFFALFAAFATLAIMPSSAEKGLDPLRAGQILVRATPVLLNETERTDRIGPLHFLGGWALSSPDRAFGGWSALHMDKGRLFAVADTGAQLSMTFTGKAETQAIIAPLPTGCGGRWNKKDQDSESIARDPATGTLWYGLEMHQHLCVLPRGERRALEFAPPVMKDWPNTGGPEAMTWLRRGGLLVFAEQSNEDPGTPVAWFATPPMDAKAKGVELRYKAPKPFLAVDAAELPDGRLLILNRAWTPPFQFTASLVLIDKPALNKGDMLKGHEIARFAPPFISDNFEGLAVEETADGLIIWLMSDNNFMPPLQRTLLLKFRLEM